MFFLLNCTDAEKTKLQRVQNRGLETVMKRDRLYCTKLLHKEAGLTAWEVRARLSGMRLMFRLKKLFPEHGENAHLTCMEDVKKM